MIKNSEKIDAIISDLEDKLDGDFSVRENDSFLSNKQKEIKSFLDIHRIKYLLEENADVADVQLYDNCIDIMLYQGSF